MSVPSYTVTIQGRAMYEHAAPDFGIHFENDEGFPSDQPYNLLLDAMAAAEKAVATGAFHYNQMALDFCCQRVSIHNASGSLVISAPVTGAEVHWIPNNLPSCFGLLNNLIERINT